MRQLTALCLVAAASLALGGCKSKPRPLQGAPDAGTPEVPIGDPGGGPGGPTAPIQISHCTPCHGTPGFTSAGADPLVSAAQPRALFGDADPGLHRTHLLDGELRRAVECASCHLLPTVPSAHPAQQQGKVTFSRLATTSWTGAPLAPTWDATARTCAGTYCHGGFKNGANATPTWLAGEVATCGSCHGVNPTSGPGGTHPTFSSTKTCGDCHGAGYTGSTVDLDLHMNGALDAPGLGCSGCHGDETRTPVASATALDPTGANLVKAAPPLDAGGGAAATGAHLAHVNQGDAAGPGPLSNALACTTCHPVPASIGHSDGNVDVAFSGLALTGGAAPAAYDFGTHGCASTYCHGSFPGGAGANPVLWTAAGKLGCASCHGVPPGPTSATVHHPPNLACGACHTGYTAAAVVVATHVDGVVQHVPATGCTQCHGDLATDAVASGDVLAAPGSVAGAPDAHGNTATSARGVGAHAAHLGGTTWRTAPIPCGECHAVPGAGDVAHAAGDPAVSFGALASTVWAGAPAITPAWNGAGGAGTLTCSSTYCHGAFPNGAAAAPTWATPSLVTCGSCHGASPTNGPGGTHPVITGLNCGSCHGGSYTNTAVDKDLHMNGALDGGGESTGGGSCSGCHAALFAAMNGGTTHLTRHGLGNVAGTNDAFTDSGITWASPLGANAASARSCVNMCHGDHPHDLTSPATATHENNAYLDATSGATRANGAASRIGPGGTGGTPNRAATDFDGAQANGGMCVSCHRNPISAGGPVVDKAAFDASAHDFTANTAGGTTYTWRYLLHDGGLFARDCTKCHASAAEGTTPQVTAGGSATVAVHYGDEASLLAGAKTPAGVAAGFVCYNCHGSAANPADGAQGNRSGKDIQSQIAHATTAGDSGHPAVSDTVHDSAAEEAGAVFGNALGVAAGAGQRHASCQDCHDPHEARAGTHAATTNLAGPPLHGAWGAQLSTPPAFWAVPTSASFTKKTIVAGTDVEATLCFKCHSSWYGTLPTSPSGGYAGTDTAREFNPMNTGSFAGSWANGETAGGYHPVLAAAGSNLGAVRLTNLVTTNIAWSTTARNLMTCTDCHESDQVTDPNGPHGSAAGFILRGPNTLWNDTMAATTTGMPAGAFCANCHSSTWVGSRYGTQHHQGRAEHRVNCWNCHARVPHGGPRPGMLVAPAGASANVGGPIATWDTASPYWGLGTSASKLYIVSYPVNNTTNWGQSNCGCNGTGH